MPLNKNTTGKHQSNFSFKCKSQTNPPPSRLTAAHVTPIRRSFVARPWEFQYFISLKFSEVPLQLCFRSSVHAQRNAHSLALFTFRLVAEKLCSAEGVPVPFNTVRSILPRWDVKEIGENWGLSTADALMVRSCKAVRSLWISGNLFCFCLHTESKQISSIKSPWSVKSKALLAYRAVEQTFELFPRELRACSLLVSLGV